MSKNSERRARAAAIASNSELGVSFSVIECAAFNLDWEKVLKSTINLGFKRFRLMSYWNIHENERGNRNFELLDAQIALIKKAGGTVSLAIGMRQPRWPETHMPEWAKKLPKNEAADAYMDYHEAVIKRYRNEPILESWQLENEFWLKSFGENFDFSRARLQKEFQKIRELDRERPIIMSVAHFGSLPLFGPTPDIYATSVYRVIYSRSIGYTYTNIKPWQYRLKKNLITLLHRRPFIIHELQTEPWGPKGTAELSRDEQLKSMNEEEIKQAIAYARDTTIPYIDLWGSEWWYWSKTKFADASMQKIVTRSIQKSKS